MTVSMIAALLIVVAMGVGHFLGEIPTKHNWRAITVACLLFGVVVFVFSGAFVPATHLFAFLHP